MSLDPKLLDVLACPKDKGPLRYLEQEQLLVNERLGLAYRIDDGIPVLLIDEATEWTPSAEEPIKKVSHP
ncbi:Trm112 family protein [Corynebacterium pacaense]|uniref:Trm112 family protein n=1 Tax=Corynebacterium pacaense TaxID=1816684 RepID=UPI0009B976E3|nr:Trm112 family protein [Corynebacterium pacaense]